MPETGIEPVRPLSGKRRILRVMRPSKKLAVPIVSRLSQFGDQQNDQRRILLSLLQYNSFAVTHDIPTLAEKVTQRYGSDLHYQQ